MFDLSYYSTKPRLGEACRPDMPDPSHIRPDPTRFDPAQLGPARLGPVRLDPVRRALRARGGMAPVTFEFEDPSLTPCSLCMTQAGESLDAVTQDERRLHVSSQSAMGGMAAHQVSPGLSIVESRMTFDEETTFSEDYRPRDVLQLSFCLAGTCGWNYLDGGKAHWLAPSTCSLQRNTAGTCTSVFEPGEHRTLSIVLDRRRFAAFEEAAPKAPGSLGAQTFEMTPGLHNAVRRLADCPPHQKLRDMFLEGLALEVLSTFCTEALERPAAPSRLSRSDIACLDSARTYIDERLDQPLTIAQVARACFVSETKLKAGFKELFGCTVWEYLNGRRMTRAYELLRHGHSVRETAQLVGYASPSHFSETFRKRWGISPSEMSPW